MDTKDKPELIQLLVISNQFHLVNKLLSALREDGIELKAFGANDKAGLIEQLKLQSWDLVLCCEDAGISLASAQETIHDLGLELPIIFLADEDSKVDAAELLNSGKPWLIYRKACTFIAMKAMQSYLLFRASQA